MHALLISFALTWLAVDRIIVRHAVTFDNGRGASGVPGTDVLNASGARLDSRGVSMHVAAPIAGSAILLAGAFAATHLVSALWRVAAERVGVSNRSIARALFWNRGRASASSRIRDALVRSGGKYMPSDEIRALINACVIATIASTGMASWIHRRSRGSSGGVLRNRLRIVNAAVWLAMGVLMVPNSLSRTKGGI